MVDEQESNHSPPKRYYENHPGLATDDDGDFVFRPKRRSMNKRSSSASYISKLTSFFDTSRPESTHSDKANRKSSSSSNRKLSKEKLPKTKPVETSVENEDDENVGRDPLPETQKGLDARMNHHLSELDRLMRIVNIFNELILEHEMKLRDVSTRSDAPNMTASLNRIQALVEETRGIRNSHGKFVGYHRIELERITNKGLELKRQSGRELKIPEVMKNLTNEFVWRELFLV